MNGDIYTRFLSDTAHHVMWVELDQGLHRHLKFRHAGPNYRSYCWFDLITVPGSLVFRGDGESYVFAATRDMFELFRDSSDGSQINPYYWSQKLTSARREDVQTYDPEIFKARVSEEVDEATQDGQLPGLRAAVERDVFEAEEFSWEDETAARRLLDDFEHYEKEEDRFDYRKRPDFQFMDMYEVSFRDYDWWFLWALHAIVWGIAKYDRRPVPEVPASVQPPAGIPSAVRAPRMVTAQVQGGVL